MQEPKAFERIRPFRDHEVQEALQRITKEKGFVKVLNLFFPDYPVDEVFKKLQNVNTIDDFQAKYVAAIVHRILNQSTTGISFSGLENIEKNESYLFITNHRDIILDSAILNDILFHNKYIVSEIAIGSNLLILPWIKDLVRLNRSFIVKRNIPWKEMYDYSKLLSLYMRHSIIERKRSIWIAQREGRTKNGDDQTQISLLKMLNISGTKSFSENFDELRIVPVTISYQFEPCDTLKVKELYQKIENPDFKKNRMDDLMSMSRGLITPKGKVHFSFGTPIQKNQLEAFDNIENKNDQIQPLAQIIDKQIYNGYNLTYPNYVAADILYYGDKFVNLYTSEEKTSFMNYLNESLKTLTGNRTLLEKMFLEIYANPVKNKLTVTNL